MPMAAQLCLRDMPERGAAQLRRGRAARRSAGARGVQAMKFGVTTFITDEGIRPAPLARALEERGFDSLLVHDHSHVPVARQAPFPRGGGRPRGGYLGLEP